MLHQESDDEENYDCSPKHQHRKIDELCYRQQKDICDYNIDSSPTDCDIQLDQNDLDGLDELDGLDGLEGLEGLGNPIDSKLDLSDQIIDTVDQLTFDSNTDDQIIDKDMKKSLRHMIKRLGNQEHVSKHKVLGKSNAFMVESGEQTNSCVCACTNSHDTLELSSNKDSCSDHESLLDYTKTFRFETICQSLPIIEPNKKIKILGSTIILDQEEDLLSILDKNRKKYTLHPPPIDKKINNYPISVEDIEKTALLYIQKNQLFKLIQYIK